MIRTNPSQPPAIGPVTVAVITILLAVSLFFLYRIASQALFADRIYPSVTVAGTNVGGETVQQASTDLRARLQVYADRPVPIQAGDQSVTLTAGDLGFTPRSDELAKASYDAGRSGDLLTRLAGPLAARWSSPVTAPDWDIDEAKIASAAQQIAARVDRQPTEAQVALSPDPTVAAVAIQAGRTGQVLDQARARDAIRWYISGMQSGPLTLPVQVSEPPIDEAAVSSAVQQVAARVDQPPVDAKLVVDPTSATVSVQPSQTGQSLDQAKAADAIRAAMASAQSGPLTLPMQATQPRIDEARLQPLQARAQQIIGSNLAVSYNGQTWAIPPTMLASTIVYEDNPPSLAIDTRPLAPFVQQIASQTDQAPKNATLSIANGKVQTNPEAAGLAVDQAATVSALDQALNASGGTGTVALVTAPVPAATTAADLASSAQKIQAVIDRGMTLTFGNVTYPVTGARFAALLTLQSTDPRTWNVALDQSKLGPILADAGTKYKQPALSTRFTWDNGKVGFLGPSRAGMVLDQKAAVPLIAQHWRDGKPIALPLVQVPNAIDDSYLAFLSKDLKQVTQTRSTSYAGSIPERAHNIALAAQRLNGVVVLPGQPFSFNDTVGPQTIGAGFEWGFGYETTGTGSSTVVPSVAGGICQVATTTFQPIFWGGYEIDERHNHMFVMQHYMDKGYYGLDATVSPDDGVDFKFTNVSDHALLIQAWANPDDATINVDIVTTPPSWNVQVAPEVVSDYTPAPKDEVISKSPLFASGRTIVLEVAQFGLTSHVTRNVVYPDGHVRTLNLSSTYLPSHYTVLEGTG